MIGIIRPMSPNAGVYPCLPYRFLRPELELPTGSTAVVHATYPDLAVCVETPVLRPPTELASQVHQLSFVKNLMGIEISYAPEFD